jgi:hypothetical protein
MAHHHRHVRERQAEQGQAPVRALRPGRVLRPAQELALVPAVQPAKPARAKQRAAADLARQAAVAVLAVVETSRVAMIRQAAVHPDGIFQKRTSGYAEMEQQSKNRSVAVTNYF